MSRHLAVFLAVGGFAAASAVGTAVTPVAKVIALLGRLQEKIEEEGKAEAVEYDKFACFCKDQADFKQHHIEKSQEKIDTLTATVDALEADLADLSEDISGLTTDIEGATKAHGDETASSTTAHEAYLANDKMMTESIEAIKSAIEAMKASKQQLKGNAKLDLAQLTAKVGAKAGAMLRAKLSQEPAAYTYQSNDIIGVLKGLYKDFVQQKKELDESEFARASTSDKKLLGLANTKKFKTKAKAEKEEVVGMKTEEKHTAEADRTAETTAMDADKAFRAELTTTCEEKATEFDARSKARAAELTTMAEAIESLKTGAAPKYGANKKLVGLVRTSVHQHLATRAPPTASNATAPTRAPAFLQARADGRALGAITQALAALDTSARRLGSPALSALAAKVALKEDHFVKVRGLIKDLVARLEAEAASEADQKSFCDTEMKKAVTARDGHQLEKEKQATLLTEKTAEKAKLTSEIAGLSEEIASLNKALNEATQLRSEEKADNERTVSDATSGKAAVEEAIKLLKAYYEAQGGAASLLQNRYTPPNADREGKTVGDRAPKMSYSGEYRGAQDASKGILGLLEVIRADFERTETTVSEAEEHAQADFEEYESDNKADVAAKDSEKTEKETALTAAEEAITSATDALKDATGLHEGSLKELEMLTASCVEGEESFAERKAQREKEIEALKQALTILDEWKS